MTNSKISVLVVEDQELLATLIESALEQSGYQVVVKHSISEAIAHISKNQPNIVVTDLNFGLGPNGLDLINYIDENYPWIGRLVLSAHNSVESGTGESWSDGQEVIHIVKSEIDSLQQIQEAIRRCLSSSIQSIEKREESGLQFITKSQAEVLHLVMQGLSNLAIAKSRGTTIRAVEALLIRTYHSLGIANNDQIDCRTIAIQMLESGKIDIH
jgi:DNA-binding NarL/FixJ family response regulator